MKAELITELEGIYNLKKDMFKVKFIGEDNTEGINRITKGRNGLMVMANGSKTRGYSITEHNYNTIIGIKEIQEKPINIKWINSIDKAITLLKKSGLWTDMLKDLETAKSIGYDKISLAYKTSWLKFSDDYNENERIRTEKVKEIDSRLIEKEHIKTSILWYMANPLKIKKMNFGIRTSEYISNIAYAILHKEKLNIPTIRVNYDISFEYNPEQNKAWYSEEYKNCGNGHYYLALSNEYALFYEDD